MKREVGNKTDEGTSVTTSCRMSRVCRRDNESALAQDRLFVWRSRVSWGVKRDARRRGGGRKMRIFKFKVQLFFRKAELKPFPE